MKLRQYLRVSDPKQLRLERILHYCPGRVIIETKADIRYLQFQLTDEHNRQASAFLDIDNWLQNMDSHLPGIPWQQVPLGYLVSWLNTLHLSFIVEGVLWAVEYTLIPVQPFPNRLIALPADPCSILCTDWPGAVNEAQEKVISLDSLPLTLRYVLGKSQIPLSALTELESGDLLLIREQKWSLEIGCYSLFTFSYQGNDEVIVKQSIIDNLPPERGEEEHILDWKNLPVDLEFVLDSHMITLGNLNNITVGSVLPVSPDAELKIKIYLNRKFFAFGELVALESGGLAVEINQINMHPEQTTSHTDAE